MPRVTKCRSCLVKDQSEKTKMDDMYFHEGDCLDKYIRHKEFQKKEQEEKNELFFYLLKLHNLSRTSEIPSIFYQRVEDLRNDNWILGKYDKKYKQGIRYKGILYTYQYCEDLIRASINKMVDKPLIEQMNYSLGIVRNNLVDAYNHAKKNAKQKHNTNNTINQIESMAKIKEKVKQAQFQSHRENNNKDVVNLTTLLD
ncbi:hypothetical protein GCM10023310_69230 [Paenibacillus vulneris]|uniref:Uncharacterized protein n=1 Tax=Paenibacillus vulneris TaxID=1133364 RepID=A0ABW3UFA7_9BACL